jgi:hypothetical protein
MLFKFCWLRGLVLGHEMEVTPGSALGSEAAQVVEAIGKRGDGQART